jgi:glycosyltransferase 2 family protein
VLGRFSDTAERRIREGLEVLPAQLRARMGGMLSSFVQGVASARSRFVIAEIVGLSAIEWALFVGTAYCLMKAVPWGVDYEISDAAIFLGFVAFGAAVQVPGIGGGVQVASAVVLTQLFGLTLEEASGFALLFWLVSFVSIVPVGMVLAFREGLRWSSLRHVADET